LAGGQEFSNLSALATNVSGIQYLGGLSQKPKKGAADKSFKSSQRCRIIDTLRSRKKERNGKARMTKRRRCTDSFKTVQFVKIVGAKLEKREKN
jgi:hypothetical protein